MLPIAVVDGDTGRPVPRPVIFVSSPATTPGADNPQRPALIGDDEGRGVVRHVPPGPLTLRAEAPGYLPGEHGARWAGDDGVPLQVGLDMPSGPVEVRLWLSSAIAGRVVDAGGNPMSDVRVGAFSRTYWPNERYVGAAEALTDSQGTYQLSSLEPGDYVVAAVFPRRTVPVSAWNAFTAAVSASPQEQAAFANRWTATGAPNADAAGVSRGDRILVPFTPGAVIAEEGEIRVAGTTFYPGVVDPGDAATIQLDSGDTVSGIDLTVVHSQGSAVTGVLLGPDGPVAHAGIRLMRRTFSTFARQDGLVTVEGVTDDLGRFVFDAVVPGTYDLWAFMIDPGRSAERSAVSVATPAGVQPLPSGRPSVAARPAGAATIVGQVSVAVGPRDGGPVEALVPLRPAASVSGAVSFDAAADLEQGPLTVRLTRVRGLTAGLPYELRQDLSVTIDGPGPFAVNGVLPGAYRLEVEAKGGRRLLTVSSDRDSSLQPLGGLMVGTEDFAGVEIVVTSQPARLEGLVLGSSDETWKTSVVVFPVDRQLRRDPGRTTAVRVSPEGQYLVEGLPPGEYFVAATEQALPPHRLLTTLERLVPMARRVTMGRGSQLVNLQVREVP